VFYTNGPQTDALFPSPNLHSLDNSAFASRLAIVLGIPSPSITSSSTYGFDLSQTMSADGTSHDNFTDSSSGPTSIQHFPPEPIPKAPTRRS